MLGNGWLAQQLATQLGQRWGMVGWVTVRKSANPYRWPTVDDNVGPTVCQRLVLLGLFFFFRKGIRRLHFSEKFNLLKQLDVDIGFLNLIQDVWDGVFYSGISVVNDTAERGVKLM
ncbi:hypothetical protein AVEN_49797-1 [Araneus ventricosus]|uniref:Uncharacterized protein n=1 Tax=Araneus ventricosus TaxID=182803 RepID=A0A4Y2QH67_ARAVE|nr:hypothetical protein AVEN_49797-1 [Araneus ventricosus]